MNLKTLHCFDFITELYIRMCKLAAKSLVCYSCNRTGTILREEEANLLFAYFVQFKKRKEWKRMSSLHMLQLTFTKEKIYKHTLLCGGFPSLHPAAFHLSCRAHTLTKETPAWAFCPCRYIVVFCRTYNNPSFIITSKSAKK